MNKKSFGIFIGLLFLPVYAHAAIQINEIAWMGTIKGSTNEWIELYNNGDASVDVTGWKIYTKDKGIKETALSGTIASKGFYILERTDDTTLPDITADTIYTGDLSNSGEDLILVDNLGTIVQELNYVGGWPAGDNTTKDTMQWDGTKWITANPTPKAQTVGYISSSSTPVSQVVTSGGAASGGGSSSVAIIPKNTPHIEFNFPETIYTHISYDFGAKPVLEYMTAYDGYFVWSMGDGASFKKTRNEMINYSYQYPGEYTVNFAYYHNAYDKTPVLKGKKVIDVVDPGIVLSTTDNNNALQIKNTTTRDADISGWILTQGSQSVTLPDLFVISAGNTITIPKNILGFDTITNIVMTTPNNTFVASNSYTTPIIVQKEKSIPTYIAVHTSTKKVITSEVLGASVPPVDVAPVPEENQTTQNRTKKIIFGAVLLTVIGLLILLERFMVQKE